MKSSFELLQILDVHTTLMNIRQVTSLLHEKYPNDITFRDFDNLRGSTKWDKLDHILDVLRAYEDIAAICETILIVKPDDQNLRIKLGKWSYSESTEPEPDVKPEAQGKIRILHLAANPLGTKRLQLDKEVREIEERLRLAKLGDKFEFIPKGAVRIKDLQDHLLNYEPHIVHFSGHGNKSGKIILEDNAGKPKTVPKSALSTLFGLFNDTIRLVVLNACLSKEQADGISQEIDCVVGMSEKIKDVSAIQFSSSFYQGLGFGKSIEKAFKLGSVQIDLQGLDQSAVPQLIPKDGVDPNTIIFVQ
ncbi:CHAT domain-containing protein [Anaerolineales bacterium HSG25]|nr:CHAT domain-containing protein [Anaerolineales bacterium HSG25]